MSYVVTTHHEAFPMRVTTCTVDTLDEANKIITRITRVAGICDVPESGGTISLPDGTVVEVERVPNGQKSEEN